jgi:hypothetical protein
MAKIKLNPIIEQMRGPVGDLVFKRYGEGVVVGRKPNPTRDPSEAQLEHQERFRQAVVYGQLAMADPEKKAAYEDAAKASGKPIFSLMVADFFRPPVVDQVDLSKYLGAVGDEIAIQTHDNFKVVGAQVNIMLSNGQALESGTAIEAPPKSGRWVYTATQAATPGATVRVVVTVVDRPGRSTTATAEKSL